MFKSILRKIPYLNEWENANLTLDLKDRITYLKERNSKAVFEKHYLPEALKAILEEDNYLATLKDATPRATAMMLYDLSTGVLDEFYNFVK